MTQFFSNLMINIRTNMKNNFDGKVALKDKILHKIHESKKVTPTGARSAPAPVILLPSLIDMSPYVWPHGLLVFEEPIFRKFIFSFLASVAP